MIFKRLQRKKTKLCYICEQEMLKSNFFSKNRSSWNALLEYIPALVIWFLRHNNLIHKVWVDLINERKNKTQGFLGKISKFHWINLSWGQWVLPETYNYLNPTELLDLGLLRCSVYPFGLWIYFGSITWEQFLSYSILSN